MHITGGACSELYSKTSKHQTDCLVVEKLLKFYLILGTGVPLMGLPKCKKYVIYTVSQKRLKILLKIMKL